MILRALLTDYAAINILKFLYDRESENNSVYSIKFKEIIKRFPQFKDINKSIVILKNFDLINEDFSEEDKIIVISAKGKHFIDIFDKLAQLINIEKDLENKKSTKSFQIKYDLNQKEKKIMILIYKLSKETGNNKVLFDDLTRELYPKNNVNTSEVEKNINQLEELNLVEKTQVKNKTFLELTPTGERTIKEQLVESLL
jgi:DNA-binding MarR family transcriptional regulator